MIKAMARKMAKLDDENVANFVVNIDTYDQQQLRKFIYLINLECLNVIANEGRVERRHTGEIRERVEEFPLLRVRSNRSLCVVEGVKGENEHDITENSRELREAPASSGHQLKSVGSDNFEQELAKEENARDKDAGSPGAPSENHAAAEEADVGIDADTKNPDVDVDDENILENDSVDDEKESL